MIFFKTNLKLPLLPAFCLFSVAIMAADHQPENHTNELSDVIPAIMSTLRFSDASIIENAFNSYDVDARRDFATYAWPFFKANFIHDSRDFLHFVKTYIEISDDPKDALMIAFLMTRNISWSRNLRSFCLLMSEIGKIKQSDRSELVSKVLLNVSIEQTMNAYFGVVNMLARNIKLISLLSPENRTDDNCLLLTSVASSYAYSPDVISALEQIKNNDDLLYVAKMTVAILNNRENDDLVRDTIDAVRSWSENNRDLIEKIIPAIEHYSSYQRYEIIYAILSVDKSERDEIFTKALAAGAFSRRADWVICFTKIVKHLTPAERTDLILRDIAAFLDAAQTWFSGSQTSDDCSEFFIVLTGHLPKNSEDDFVDVIRNSARLLNTVREKLSFEHKRKLSFDNELSSDCIFNSLEIFAYFPAEQRSNILEILENLQERSLHQSFMDTLRNFRVCLGELMQSDETIKEYVLEKWSAILLSDDEKAVLQLSETIIFYFELFGLHELHPLVQDALRVRTLLENTDDERNPYNFHNKVKRLRAEVVELDDALLPSEIIEGLKVQVNQRYLKALPALVVRFKDLPRYSKDFLSTMRAQIERRLSAQLTIDNYDALIQGSLGSGYVQSLLNIRGKPDDIVPYSASKIIAVVAHLETLDNTCVPDAFSDREEKFLLMLSSVRECVTGKDGGIDDAYARIPRSAQYASISESKTHGLVENIVREKVEAMLSGDNLFFKELVNGAPNEEVQQAIHQARYVENIIAPDVGSSKPLRFDCNTQTLNWDLVSRPKHDVMRLFHKYFPPHLAVDAIRVRVNQGLKEPGNTLFANIGELLDVNLREKCWSFDEDYNPQLTEFGAAHLLVKLSALNLVSR